MLIIGGLKSRYRCHASVFDEYAYTSIWNLDVSILQGSGGNQLGACESSIKSPKRGVKTRERIPISHDQDLLPEVVGGIILVLHSQMNWILRLDPFIVRISKRFGDKIFSFRKTHR